MLKAWVDFSLFINIYCGNLMNFMEVNLIKPWGLYYGWVFLEFLTLRLAYIWPLDTHWPHFWFSNPCTYSSGDFHLWVYVLVNCYVLLSRVSLSNLEGSGLFSFLPFLSLFFLSSWFTQDFFTLESVEFLFARMRWWFQDIYMQKQKLEVYIIFF